MVEFRMPSLGSDMQAGTLLEWRVKPGDHVKRRDVIAVIETDKAAIEIEVYEDGIIEALLVQPGQRVAVGTIMAIIRTEAEPKASAPDKAPPKEASQAPAGGEGVPEPAPGLEKEKSRPSLPAAGARRVKASPYARKLAAESFVDLSTLAGTGRTAR